MKRAVLSTLLAGLALRLAVLAGAGDVLAGWVRDLGAEGMLVETALSLELGVPAERRGAEGEFFGPPAPAETEAAVLFPFPEEGDAPGEREPEPSPEPEPEPQTVALSFSGDALRNRTSLDPDLEALAAEGVGLTLPAGEPQILIIHTHSSEAYSQDPYAPYEESDPYRTEDPNYSVIRVGEALRERFEAQGLTVLHDTELYDYPSYTGSYSRSGAAVERYLADYPSLRVVIDLHRDAIGDGDVVYKTQATLDGRTSAQVMLLVGTGENGLPHPNWRENLKLALYLQNAAQSRWPSLMRPIALVSERYNQQLSPGMLILEVGSTGNSLREAVLAAELFGDAAGEALGKLIAP